MLCIIWTCLYYMHHTASCDATQGDRTLTNILSVSLNQTSTMSYSFSWPSLVDCWSSNRGGAKIGWGASPTLPKGSNIEEGISGAEDIVFCFLDLGAEPAFFVDLGLRFFGHWSECVLLFTFSPVFNSLIHFWHPDSAANSNSFFFLSVMAAEGFFLSLGEGTGFLVRRR